MKNVKKQENVGLCLRLRYKRAGGFGDGFRREKDEEDRERE